MGYSYKNIKTRAPNKNSSTLKDFRKKFSLCLNYRRERKGAEVCYLDEYTFSANEFLREEAENHESEQSQEVVILVLANSRGIINCLVKN
jgi:hypothetical protein